MPSEAAGRESWLLPSQAPARPQLPALCGNVRLAIPLSRVCKHKAERFWMIWTRRTYMVFGYPTSGGNLPSPRVPYFRHKASSQGEQRRLGDSSYGTHDPILVSTVKQLDSEGTPIFVVPSKCIKKVELPRQQTKAQHSFILQ